MSGIDTPKFQFHNHNFITPLLEKPSLDKDTLNNYCPISNLSLISKITECIVKSPLNEHLPSNSLHYPNQSVYTKQYSTETNFLSLHDHVIAAVSHQPKFLSTIYGRHYYSTGSIKRIHDCIAYYTDE